MGASHLELVRHALAIAREKGLTEVEISEGDDFQFSAILGPRKRSTPEAIASADSPPEPDVLIDIVSPLVGYFRPNESLQIGARVESGQVVAAVSALGLLTDVEATSSGEVVGVLVEADAAVQFGQVVARLRP